MPNFIFHLPNLESIFKKQTVAEATILITVFIFLSKVIGYFREVFIAKYFGVTGQTDAFLVALLISTSIMGLLSSGLSVLIIPVYVEKRKNDPAKAKIFANQIFLLLCGITLIFSLVLFFFAPFFVKLVAFGLGETRFNLAVTFTRYLIPLGFATVFIGFFTGLYQARRQFLYPTLITVIGNALVVLSLILLTPRLGINSWTVGYLLFAALSFFALWGVLWRKGGFFQNFFLKNIDWAEIRHFFWLLFPLTLSGGVVILNQIIDKTIASFLATGSIAILNFAQGIYSIPLSFLSGSLVVALYPVFASLALDKSQRFNYARVLREALSLSWYLIIPISFIFMILSQQIVRLLFQRGAFTVEATNLTAFALSMYSIGLFAHMANYFLIKTFYSFKNTKVPLILTFVIVVTNIIGNIILSRILGVAGIALATSISVSLGFILYFSILSKYFKGISFKSLWEEAFRVILASIPLGACSFFLRPYLSASPDFFHLLTKFILVGALLSLLYLLSGYLLKLEGLKITISFLKRKFS